MTSLILLNGPPRSGKDEAVRIIKKHLIGMCGHAKLSTPLKQVLIDTFNPTKNKALSESLLERNKDKPIFSDAKYTPRDFQIAYFKLLADMFGDTILGKLLAIKLIGDPMPYMIISDAGRTSEVKELLKYIPPKNVLLIKLFRPNTSFDNDCREYVDHEILGIRRVVEVQNRYELDMYEMQITKIIDKWRNGELDS